MNRIYNMTAHFIFLCNHIDKGKGGPSNKDLRKAQLYTLRNSDNDKEVEFRCAPRPFAAGSQATAFDDDPVRASCEVADGVAAVV